MEKGSKALRFRSGGGSFLWDFPCKNIYIRKQFLKGSHSVLGYKYIHFIKVFVFLILVFQASKRLKINIPQTLSFVSQRLFVTLQSNNARSVPLSTVNFKVSSNYHW